MIRFFQKLCCTLMVLSGIVPVKAQISHGGQPLSMTPAFHAQYVDSQLKTITLPPLDLKKIFKEDLETPGVRVAAPIKVDFGLQNAGEWLELGNGDRLWRLKIRSTHAKGLLFLYDDLYLPPGATLFMYNEDGTQVHGAYTHASNTPNFTFMTGFIYGEVAVLEYFEPKEVRGQGLLHIFRVDHAYKKEVTEEKTILENDFGFGASSACNVNINCPEGTNWQNQKRGICRVIVVVEEGTGFCSGNLMNNTLEDLTPYVLSAFHCQDGFTPKYDFWRFDFNYESTNCSNPAFEPSFQSVLGSTLRASRRQNDFLLLELDTIPPSYNVYFNGWDRKTTPPTTSFSIHHPRGDIKKIAVDNQNAVIYSIAFEWKNAQGSTIYTTPVNHMFRIRFDASTVQVGSSGAALFDQNGRIVGQLHGGTDLGDCNFINAYYDRFTLSWEGGGTPDTRLKDWLDPDTSGVSFLDGLDQTSDGMGAIGGFVLDANGKGVSGVNMRLVGIVNATTVTDTSGAYRFNNLPLGEVFGVSLEKNYGDRNGIGVVDILLISRHILGVQSLDSPLKILAADVDGTKSLNIVDLIKIRKVILGIDTAFAEAPSWKFLPEGFIFSDPLNPWDDFLPTIFHLPTFNDDVLDFNFTAYKMGDVDVSANPRQ